MAETYDIASESWVDQLLGRLSGKCITINGEPYLTRYYLVGNGLGRGVEIYIHKLHRRDSFRWLHNHPWTWFLSIVLSGYYIQRVIQPNKGTAKTEQRVTWINFFRKRTRYHAITEVAPGGTWTLVIVPPKTRSATGWGFWNEDLASYVPHESQETSDESETIHFGKKKLFD